MYTIENCFECKHMLERGSSLAEVTKDHASCHGWLHCGDECCGACVFCDGSGRYE